MTSTDYYRILGVEPDADAKTIKDAYRKLAFQYHPDRNQDNPQAADRMKAVNEAYAVLSNEDKRRRYDALRGQFGDGARQKFRGAYTEQEIFRDSDIHQMFEEMARAFGLRGFDEIFREYQRGGEKFTSGGRGMFGGGFHFFGTFGPEGRRNVLPGFLQGGLVDWITRKTFERLTGQTVMQHGQNLTDTITVSPELARDGGPCAYLHRQRGKKIVVKIPPGVRDGQMIRLAGLGAEGVGGGQSGDLYLTVRAKASLLKRAWGYLTR